MHTSTPLNSGKTSRPRSIDDFIAFVRNLPEDTWLHVHCQGGVGRTNMYLVFYDFLRNPDVPEKAEMIPLVYKYIQDQMPKGFKRSWTQWKANK